MITSELKFGSYVLKKVILEEDEDTSTLEPVSDCCIGPIWTPLELLAVIPHTHDTSIFRFKLPSESPRLNLPIGATLLIRGPGKDHDGGDAIRPYTSITDNRIAEGYFDILCKRYDQWGVKESLNTHFLFTKTDHSYRPAGALSNHIHSLRVGDTIEFKHSRICLPRFSFPFRGVRTLTVVAVGAGIAPMVQLIRELLRPADTTSTTSTTYTVSDSETHTIGDEATEEEPIRIVLLYGTRKVEDILMRQQLDAWSHQFDMDGEAGRDRFRVVYCVGSRWHKVYMCAKTKTAIPPPPLPGFDTLRRAEQGWVNGDKIARLGFPPSPDTRVLVCGLPAVYDKLCGPRSDRSVPVDSVLGQLGYTDDMVIKL